MLGVFPTGMCVTRSHPNGQPRGDWAMRLTLLSHSDQITRLECEGDITQYQFTPGKDPVQDLLGPYIYRQSVLLSLEKTTYIDSSGISWLIGTHKQFERAGGRLILHSLTPMVMQVVQLLKLNTILTIAANEADARQLAQGAKA